MSSKQKQGFPFLYASWTYWFLLLSFEFKSDLGLNQISCQHFLWWYMGIKKGESYQRPFDIFFFDIFFFDIFFFDIFYFDFFSLIFFSSIFISFIFFSSIFFFFNIFFFDILFFDIFFFDIPFIYIFFFNIFLSLSPFPSKIDTKEHRWSCPFTSTFQAGFEIHNI